MVVFDRLGAVAGHICLAEDEETTKTQLKEAAKMISITIPGAKKG